MGGQHLWSDVYFYAGWRIQKNIVTKHYRLLSARKIRLAWGSYEGCLKVLNIFRKALGLKNPNTHLIVMLHGIAGWKETLYFLKKVLRKNGYFAEGYSYASLQDTLAEQARDLNTFLSRLEGIEEITLIGHSLGGIVIRKALGTTEGWQKRIKLKGVIMIGTPNNGAILADFTKRFKALGKIAPKVRDQLTKDYAKTLPLLKGRVGLIAGSLNSGKGINPLINGDDDGVVGVEEVWMEGNKDRLIITSDHFTLPNRKASKAAVLRFLDGKTVSDRS